MSVVAEYDERVRQRNTTFVGRRTPFAEGLRHLSRGTGAEQRPSGEVRRRNMSEMTPEKLAQRIVHVGLLDGRQMEAVWADLGSSDIDLSEFSSLLLRKNLLTNFQIDRLVRGERGGYFYGNYRVLYLAGSGTFARVYRSVHRDHPEKVVAVKVLRKRFREDAASKEAFLREGRIGSKLRHPNIVPIYDVSEDGAAEPYLVMEFVEGRTLREFVKVRKQLEPAEALKLTQDILAGLIHAGEKGMQHRDLKMSNVLVTSRGQAKLVDFGLAAIDAANSAEVADGDFKNPRTIDYAGLERVSGVRHNDSRSDLFFVGCMLYNMLTGIPPLSETKDRMQRLSASRYQDVKPITDVRTDLPRIVVQFVQKAMEVNADKRFSSPTEMWNEVKRVITKLDDPNAELASDTPESRYAARQASIAAAGKVNAGRSDLPDMEGQSKTVMLVESKIDIQDVLRERLKKHGYRVLIFSDPDRAVKRFQDADEKVADCVVFCTPELGESALQAFNRFGTLEKTEKIPAVLFVDQRQQSLIKAAQLAPHRVLLSMPLKVKELRETLMKLLAV